MPLYEYQCDACGHRFEKIVKFSDPPIETCPVCGGHVHKLMSSPAFHLKGTGWYVTDYAKKDGPTGGKASGATGDSGSKDKTESPASSDKTEKAEKAEKNDKSSGSSDSTASSSATSTASSPVKKE